MSYKALASMNEGEEGRLLMISDDKMACKLLSMGLLPGKNVRLIRKAPFGGGFYLKVQDHNIAVREEEAQQIMLEIEEEA